MEKIKLKISGVLKNVRKWVKDNPVEFCLLLAILITAAVCRLYKIDQYMTFLGDEGRDVIVVRRLLTEGHTPLIGPGTSIGSMYLGPLYYYMMAPALLIANFSPVGPAVQIAILGIITVWFVWYIGREWFGKVAGLIAAFLFAISPTIIIYSRSSWNPNIMPFFSLLAIYSIWRVWKYKELNWLVVLGIAFASVLQSHYLGLLLAPTIFIFYALTFWQIKNTPLKKTFIKKSLIGFGLFLLLMSPLLIFDLRHDWINSRAMYKFFTERQTTVSIKPWSALPKLPELFVQINTSLIGGMNIVVSKFISAFIALGFVWLVFKNRKNWKFKNIPAQYYLIFLWMAFALIGFGIYKQNIYDHYFGFVFAVPALLIGAFTSILINQGKLLKVLGIAIVLAITVFNLQKNPLLRSPNMQMQRSQAVARKIFEVSGGKPFNLAVLSERNYEDGYKYFLLVWGSTVLSADTRDKSTISDTLYVICEMEEKKCDPTHSPKSEVAHFGISVVDTKWTVDGVIIYKLSHSSTK